MPARWVPLLYLGFAHACLTAAFAIPAGAPGQLGASFYQPRMVAVVHLIALGWISASILGSVYLVGPLALRMPLPPGRLDHVAFWSFALGVGGMVGHFWLDRPGGAAWAGVFVVLGAAWVAGRVLRGLASAPVPGEVKLPIGLAFVNLLLAGGFGIALGVNKGLALYPSLHLRMVVGHAHLAAVGWGFLVVFGAGSRMIPMILPASMPRGAWVWAGAVLAEIGVLGLAGSFVFGWPTTGLFAWIMAAAVASFLSRVVWMLRHRKPPPGDLPKPDLGAAQVLLSLVYLALATALGLALTLGEPAPATGRLAMAYGVFGLVGFLSQIVVGVAARLVPLGAWLWGFADRDFTMGVPSLHRTPSRRLQASVFVLWVAGVPALAAGLGLAQPMLTRLGGGCLALGTLVNAVGFVIVLVRFWRRPDP